MSRFIEIDFSQLSSILDELQATGKRASDLKPVARKVGLVISNYTDEVFRSSPNTTVGGTVFNGEYWEPLSLEYRAARNRLKKKSKSRDNGQLLLDTGKLLQSLQVGSPNNFFASTDNSIEFGTNLSQGFNNVTRTFLAPTDSLTDLVAKAMENYIITGET